MMEESGYIRELQAEDTTDSRSRVENLQELVGVAKEFEAQAERTAARSTISYPTSRW